jgi:MFS family permease
MVQFRPAPVPEPAVPRFFDRLRLRPQFLGGLGRAMTNRDYRLYALGHLAHVHGWWGNKLGIGWMTWEMTGSAGWLGIVAFAGMIPVMVVAPFGGALADRHGHRRMAIIVGTMASIVTATIAGLALAGMMTVTILLALAVVQGTMFGLDFPARQALIPQLVRRDDLSAAIAFNATTFQVGTFIGPVIAGVVITAYGAGASVLIFAATSLWMVVMMVLIRHRHVASPERRQRGMLADIGDGFVYLAGSPAIRTLLLVSFTIGLLLRPVTDLLPGFADEVFGRGAEGLATLNAAAGLGALVCALVLVVRARTRGLVGIMAAGAICSPLAFILFTATAEFTLALPVLAVGAMTLLAAHIGAYSLVQNLVDPAMRGRVISINAAVSVGGPALGALLAGWLADLVGLRPALAITSAAALVVVLALLPVLRRRRGEMEADPE